MKALRYSYVNVQSRVHDLNPLSKTLWLLCINLLSFVLPDPAWLAILFLTIFCIGFTARLGLKRLVDAMKPLKFPIFIFLIFPPIITLQGLVTMPSENTAVTPLILEGIAYGTIIALRFSCIIYSALIFLMTTKTKDFVYSITRLGIPYRYGFMLMTIFQLIPSFEAEMNNIKYAQMARGLILEGNTFFKKYRNFFKYTIQPILISSLRKGIELATAMDSACFGIYKNRTYLEEVKYSNLDFILSFISIISTIIVFYLYITGNIPILLNFSETLRKLLFPSG
ncbi:energy-coupling factor transporter transmembrane protein EcfT [Candidatus Bathyarchaeota archaeon]|nr:energy-coupling factor transporter transmembrane protein EcfT [Candidatus Bathyarchaeota archaeon]MBS7628141.1 energy-coupling factor transporter transmembrane protein EcfT [Candidatus Bathyarchaeota archaeon]